MIMTTASSSNQPETVLAGDGGVFSFPASFAQRRLWFLDQLTPGDVSYNVAGAVGIEGPIDIHALEKSLQEIVRRHETLRTRFENEQGEPQQVIEPEMSLTLQRVDLRSASEGERLAEADRLTREESQQPFDLRRGPLFRAMLIREAEQSHRLVVTMHHIISDGWSVGVLIRELAVLYSAYSQGKPSPLPELPIQYVDYTAWQTEQLSGESLQVQLDYWKQQLNGTPAGLDMVTDRPRSNMQSTRGAQHKVRLGADLARKVRAFGQEQGATLYMVLLAAFQSLLFRYTSQPQILVGSPIAGRTRTETQPLIGFFINTLVLKAEFDDNISFRQLVKQVRETTLDAYAQQTLPFEKLVEELPPDRDLGRTPFFQAMFVLQNAPMPELQLGPATLRLVEIAPETAKYEITLSLSESGEIIEGALEYTMELFDADSMERFATHFAFLLEGLVVQPDLPVARLPLVGEEERARLVQGWSGPPDMREDEASIATGMANRVANLAKTPDKVAIVGKDEQLTYEALDRRAGHWSERLRKEGVAPGSRVAISTNEGLRAMEALLGILKAGAVPVPVDPGEPTMRMEFIFKDAGVVCVVGDEKSTHCAQQAGIRTISIHALDEQPTTGNEATPSGPSTLAGAALLLYHSGRSGKPVAVEIPHRGLLPITFAQVAEVKDTDRIGLRVKLNNEENTLLEMLRALAVGATLVDVGSETMPRRVAAMLRDQAVTVLYARAPEVELLAKDFLWAFENIRMIVCADPGDALERMRRMKPELLERLHQAYGCNETCGWWALPPVLKKDLGVTDHLATGVTLQLLDEHQEPVPEGIAGEIYICSKHIAACDERQPASGSHHDRHPRHTFASGEFGWRKSDGSLHFCGRRDGRGWSAGVRVEAEELETALKDYPGLQDEAVLVERGTISAFLVPGGDEAISTETVQRWLGQKLPAVMVPQRIHRAEKIPRRPNGQLDRKALKALSAELEKSSLTSAAYTAPRNEVERILAAIWEQTLGMDRVGIYDDFFRIGGHSLLATQVVARISDELKVELPLRRLFEATTIAQLAEIIAHSASDQNQSDAIAPIKRVARPAAAPRTASR